MPTEDRIDEVAGAVAAGGGQAFSAQVDVADEAQVLAMFAAVLPRLGGLDILVNNAGILIEKPLLDTSAADFDRLIGVNLRGVFLVGREAIRVMTRQGRAGSSTSRPSSPTSAARTAPSTAPPRVGSCR